MLLPPLLFQPLLFAIQAYAFHPHLGQARSLPRDSSLINPACMLIDLLICNSLLSQQEELRVSGNRGRGGGALAPLLGAQARERQGSAARDNNRSTFI